MRIFIYLIFLLFISCGTQKLLVLNNDDLQIIETLIMEEKLFSSVLSNESINNSLIKDLKTDLFFENGSYHEFGELRNFISDTIIDDVFNEKEINYMLSQLDHNVKWNETNLKNIEIGQNIKPKDNCFSLSKPVYTTNKVYAIIKFSSGNLYYQIADSGVILFKKENNKWKFLSSFFRTF